MFVIWLVSLATDVKTVYEIVLLYLVSFVYYKMTNSVSIGKGKDDIRYNFLIGQDGLIYEGRGWGVLGQHTDGKV
ncbi:hypothetical protein LSH36_37g04024 [Paralvinella palmiformis]|uniref:Uncharacterized protein n=1 Tax=Paralvinella palmiformis TaxID=53620 RepID=A0AAD9K9L0_9ANNE|nr:hypothetical protein LSH36_37g04024 [Paralvinella palmiformis]